jgi:ribose 5-phosphate isomerase RpiB
MDRAQIDRIVAQVLQAMSDSGDERPTGVPARGERASSETVDASVGSAATNDPPLRLVVEADVLAARDSGRDVLSVMRGAIVTPLAKDALREHNIALASTVGAAATQGEPAIGPGRSKPPAVVVAVGIVQTARGLEPVVQTALRRAGIVPKRVPYSAREGAALARQVAGAVSGEQAAWGIVVDETGMVAAAIANRAAGVRAAVAGTPLEARWARERLGANVLCIAGELVAPVLADEILAAWMDAEPAISPEIASIIAELEG